MTQNNLTIDGYPVKKAWFSCPWGTFRMLSCGIVEWTPNELLAMSAEEQFRQNKAAGYFDDKKVIYRLP